MFSSHSSHRGRSKANVIGFLGRGGKSAHHELVDNDKDHDPEWQYSSRSLSDISEEGGPTTLTGNRSVDIEEYDNQDDYPSRTRDSVDISFNSSSSFSEDQHRQEEHTNIPIELDADLDDIDNYMLSVYMNEDCSVHTSHKDGGSSIHTGLTSLSTSSSTSTMSSRKRHVGAYRNRMNRHKGANRVTGWMASMSLKSTDVFGGGWTPAKGWELKESTWDQEAAPTWEDCDAVFDAPKWERIEI